MSAIREAIARLVDAEPISAELAGNVAGEILGGEATPSQIGAFLSALRIRGERPEHVQAFARVMRSHAAPVSVREPDSLVDTCGTGGDHSGTFNISTASALVAAGAGARVAKHGNRAISGTCGSADVLAALGVNIDLTPEQAGACLDEVGCSFFFAPVFHSAMRHAGPPRREIGIRTIFNMLGPLSNPAGAKRQVIGVYSAELTEVFARVLLDLGSTHVFVVHGEDGLDEITLTGPTRVTEAKNGAIKSFTIDPEDFRLKRVAPADLLGGDAARNAGIIRGILAGENSPRRTVVELNAAAALVVADLAAGISEGLALARKAIDSGAAAAVLDRLVLASSEKVSG